jgi:hypothetical protein
MEMEDHDMYRMFITNFACLLLICVVPPVISAPPDDDYEVRASSGGGSWRGSLQEWTRSTVYTNIRDYADRPDEQTLNALTIEWQKPELDTLGNLCTIRGQLKMPDNARKGAKPITWLQGLTFYMGTTPGAQPNWSTGMSQADTLYETAATSPSGRFQVRFDLRETKYDRDHVQSFQFGVALAKHIVISKTSHNVVWNSRTPAIDSTLQMLSVPAAPALSRELQLINRASRWPFTNPNGVELIRAVNALRPLGKERALAVLEQYAELARSYGPFSDQEIVFWIIRLLFEPIRLDDRIPRPGIAVFLVDRQSLAAMNWPLDPMAVSGDIPFMVGRQIMMGGGALEKPSSHIRWARLHGVIRDDPLVPTANPLAAAEAILGSRRFKALDDFSRDQATEAIRSQALAMVKGAPQLNRAREEISDDEWRAHLKAAAEHGIHWDAKHEQFVTRE